MRDTTAIAIPSFRAFGCSAAGSRPARMAMKITLSIPSTTSSAISVASDTRPAALHMGPLAAALAAGSAAAAAAPSGQARSIRNTAITDGKRVTG
jgi:hypothetical protein